MKSNSTFMLAGMITIALPAHSQNLLPNPGFEAGTGAPTGWRFSGQGQGTWTTVARQGQRALAVTGDGKGSGYWRSDSVSFQSNRIYCLKFQGRRAPDATGGCVVSGPSQVNRDFRFSEDWQAYRFVFVPPTGAAGDYVRLGQWEQKGTVYFDDVELMPVIPVFTRTPEGLALGDGESIEQGVYRCRLNLGGPGANYHRTLFENRCGFNSDRWTFGNGARVVYRHQLPGNGFQSAKLRVNLNYYMGGSLSVAASADAAAWEGVGALDKDRRAGEWEIPARLLAANDLYVRLMGEGADCNLQVNGYEIEAVLQRPVADIQGRTVFVEVQRSSPELSVSFTELGWTTVGGGVTFGVALTNHSAAALRLQAAVGAAGGPAMTHRLPSLPARASLVTNFLFHADRPGGHVVRLALMAEQRRELFAGVASVSVGLLQDPRPGYWLADDATLGLWWCESGWKIGRERGLPEKGRGPIRPLSVRAARGESEAAQLVLTPHWDGALIEAKAGPLRDRRGREAAIAVELLEVAYVKVTRPTDNTCEPGWYPDPLPPLQFPLRLTRGLNQPLWVNFKVAREVAGGEYTGTLELKTTTRNYRVPLSVHVYDFELPRDTHLKSALGLGTSEINRYHKLKDPAQRQAVYEKYLQNFADHRIAPYSFFAYSPMDIRFVGDQTNKRAQVDFAKFDQAAAKWLDEQRLSTFMLPLRGMGGGTFHSRHLGELEGFKEGTPEHARLFQDYLSQIERHLKAKGWLDKAYTYWFDEPDPKDYEFVVAGMKRIKAAAPGIRRMLTEQPEPALIGHVEIWCGLTPEWTPEKVRARRAAGEEVWWYICCAPHAPYLTEFIDHPGLELRLWPWQSWQYGVQGILIWATTYWTSPSAFPPPKLQDPWADPMSYVSGYDYKPGQIGYWGNGDGRFLYPPRAALAGETPCLEGPVTSVRWENLRDGMEDYEYLWLLEQALRSPHWAGRQTKLVQEASALLTIPPAISQDTRNFTTDPRVLLKHRDRVARMLEQLK